MNEHTLDLFIALASTFCMMGIVSDVFIIKTKGKESVLFTSPVFLPLYSTGIFQWLLFGIHVSNRHLITTCTIQLLALMLISKQYYYHQKND